LTTFATSHVLFPRLLTQSAIDVQVILSDNVSADGTYEYALEADQPWRNTCYAWVSCMWLICDACLSSMRFRSRNQASDG